MAEKSPDKLIEEHLATLPEPVRKAIASFDWAREVFDIGRKHNMHIDRIGELQTEVMLVVLGLISPRDFQTELMERIEPNREIALEVSDEVNKRVFIRIRDYMKDFYEREGSYVPEEKEDEIKSGEKNILRGAGIKIGDEANEPEPIPVVSNPEVRSEPTKQSAPAVTSSMEDDGIVSLISDEDLEPVAPVSKIDPIVSKVSETMGKPEVRKAPITVIKAVNAPKGFLDPYREPVE